MKRVIFAAVVVCVMCSGAWAVSEDMSVYVRQDVFDAKMETLFLRLHGEIESLGTRLEGKIDALSERIDGVEKSLSEKIDAVDKKIDGVEKSLSEKIDGVDKKLTARIDGLDKRIEDTHTFVYWILVLFGAIFLMPFVNKFWEFYNEKRKPSIPVEEIRRIVIEIMDANNAKIRG